VRIAWTGRVKDAGDVRRELVAMTKAARAAP